MCAVEKWKIYSHQKHTFRQINSLVISIVNTLVWRNFCQNNRVRVNFRNFHSVRCVSSLEKYFVKINIRCWFDEKLEIFWFLFYFQVFACILVTEWNIVIHQNLWQTKEETKELPDQWLILLHQIYCHQLNIEEKGQIHSCYLPFQYPAFLQT